MNRLELLVEIEILETEYALITNEYQQRRKHLEERISALNAVEETIGKDGKQ